tara:strand:- start:479 stop:2647 length:2169 start_codon:yes stop_codon:yes gene_type:complete
MMNNRINRNNLQINNDFYSFINNNVLKNLTIEENYFWEGFSKIIYELTPINEDLIKKRQYLQNQLNEWHKNNKHKNFNLDNYKIFLKKIGYLLDEGNDFQILTDNVDPEICSISGPQLVVPITNARYALNAVNARWGSLYDALYGTNVIGSLPIKSTYDQERGSKVVEYSKAHLDNIAPLINHKWQDIVDIRLEDKELRFFTNQKNFTHLKDLKQILGFKFFENGKINELVLLKNKLHCRILIDPNNEIAMNDPANIADIILESAVSTILDCEDSVATVDSEDKILAYKNWLGLMKGDLKAQFTKNSKIINRSLNSDIEIISMDGKKITLKGRSLMLIRNVGHLMKNPTILDKDGNEIYEGIMDAVVTSLISLYDINKKNLKNSLFDSIYIVKPKMHGPDEVEFTCKIFSHVEKLLKLPLNSIKIGIMDEERRTSVNLKECIRKAKHRLAFINTGFLDRTGDEIHTSMQAGSFLRKTDMKNSTWIKSYEDRNVDIGLMCGLSGKAQIGKGMWAMPDLMKEMLEQKISHPKAGANCAWVPSPTAATLHAIHYHLIDVQSIQNDIKSKGERGKFDDLITLPLLNRKNLSENEIKDEVENNAQGILGYVVRWVDQGIGCSKVPDINNIGLMEDRATCRISSQALVNWLQHGLITKEQVFSALKKMAYVVDKQNSKDTNYIPMSPKFDTIAFEAAKDLIFDGINQPSGYTEPILHKRRLEFKNKSH